MRWAACVVALVVSSMLGCASTAPTPDSSSSGSKGGFKSEVAGSPTLAFKKWERGSLDCANGRCEEMYRIVLPRHGVFKAKAYAPLDDAGDPSLKLTIMDSRGSKMVDIAESDGHPLLVEAELSPGLYYLRVKMRNSDAGKSQGRLQFDLMGELDWGPAGAAEALAAAEAAAALVAAEKAANELKPTNSSGSADSEMSTIASQLGVGTATAVGVSQQESLSVEVLGVEDEDGRVGFVLLDAGEPDGIEAGMRGDIEENGKVIGSVVVVEVFSTGSRAAVVGELTGEVGFEARGDLSR